MKGFFALKEMAMRTCLLTLLVVFLVLVTGVIHADPLATAPATEPSKLATERADALKKDIENFMLGLNYYGEENKNKPYYRLVLIVPPLTVPPPPPHAAVPLDQMYVHITEDQAKKVIDYLTLDGSLDQAIKEPGPATRPSEPLKGPVYRMFLPGLSLNLGWGLPMLHRLDGLRKVLDGDAAKAMDVLLGRLAGEREAWTKAAATQPALKATQPVQVKGLDFQLVAPTIWLIPAEKQATAIPLALKATSRPHHCRPTPHDAGPFLGNVLPSITSTPSGSPSSWAT